MYWRKKLYQCLIQDFYQGGRGRNVFVAYSGLDEEGKYCGYG